MEAITEERELFFEFYILDRHCSLNSIKDLNLGHYLWNIIDIDKKQGKLLSDWK